MSILLANKLSLQELNQLIEIICCLQVLQELVAARLNFQGENAHSPPPLRTPMCAGLLFSNFTSLDDIARNGWWEHRFVGMVVLQIERLLFKRTYFVDLCIPAHKRISDNDTAHFLADLFTTNYSIQAAGTYKNAFAQTSYSQSS